METNYFVKAVKIGRRSTIIAVFAFLMVCLLFCYLFNTPFYVMFVFVPVTVLFHYCYLLDNKISIKKWYRETKGRKSIDSFEHGIEPFTAKFLNKNRHLLTENMFKEFSKSFKN